MSGKTSAVVSTPVTFRTSATVFAYSQRVRRRTYATPEARGAFAHCGDWARLPPAETAAELPIGVGPEPAGVGSPEARDCELGFVRPDEAGPEQPITRVASSALPKWRRATFRDAVGAQTEGVVGVSRCMGPRRVSHRTPSLL